jgi:hypothetical protein
VQDAILTGAGKNVIGTASPDSVLMAKGGVNASQYHGDIREMLFN